MPSESLSFRSNPSRPGSDTPTVQTGPHSSKIPHRSIIKEQCREKHSRRAEQRRPRRIKGQGVQFLFATEDNPDWACGKLWRVRHAFKGVQNRKTRRRSASLQPTRQCSGRFSEMPLRYGVFTAVAVISTRAVGLARAATCTVVRVGFVSVK